MKKKRANENAESAPVASTTKAKNDERQSMTAMLREYRKACSNWRTADYKIGCAIDRLNPYWALVAELHEFKRREHYIEEVFRKLIPLQLRWGHQKFASDLTFPAGRIIRLWKCGVLTWREMDRGYPVTRRILGYAQRRLVHPSGELLDIDEQPQRSLANILLKIIAEKPDREGRAKLKPEFVALWEELPGFAKRWAEVHPSRRGGKSIDPAKAGMVRKAYWLAVEEAPWLLNGLTVVGDQKIQFRVIDDYGERTVTKELDKDEFARCERLVRFIQKFVAVPTDKPDLSMLDHKYWKAQRDHFDDFWQMVVEPTAKPLWNAAQKHLTTASRAFSDDISERYGFEWARYCETATNKDRRHWSSKIRDSMKRALREWLNAP